MSAPVPVVSQEMVLKPSDLAARAELERTWKYPPGLIGWLRNTSHVSIGKAYKDGKPRGFFFALVRRDPS